MHRFYIPPDQCKGATLALTGSEAHHASRVLRVQRGERVVVLDGAGNEFLCEVGDADRREVSLSVVEKKSIPPLPCRITLLQAVPKGKIIESIIQKATELGAARVVPILAERVVSHLDKDERAEKGAKWQHVAIEAIKQCGAAWLPQVETPVTPAEFMARGEKFEMTLAGSLRPDARHPRLCFEEFRSQKKRSPKSVAVWIGPEGDFSGSELDEIQRAGALPITFGRLVLRVETAAIYCLSILRYELQTD